MSPDLNDLLTALLAVAVGFLLAVLASTPSARKHRKSHLDCAGHLRNMGGGR